MIPKTRARLGKHRYLIGAAILVLLWATLGELVILYRVLKFHERLDALSALNFIENRLTGHLEILQFIPHPPDYLKSLAWLTDELQGQPFLLGVLVTEGRHVLLNTFPQNMFPPREVFDFCWEGKEIDQVFYLCREATPLPKRHFLILIGLDASVKHHIWQKGLLLCFLVFLVSCGLLIGFSLYVERLAQREEELSRRLEASEKLAAMGKLAAMVAHEIRNPLNALSMGLQYMQTLGELRPEIMEEIRQELTRLTELTEELLSLSHGFQIKPGPVVLDELMAYLESRFIPKAEARKIKFRTEGPKGLTIQADKRWLLRALENLLRNAFEAVSEGDQVELIVKAFPHEVHLTVKDTGPGISPETKDKLFEPFFTTKKEGFGLGLFIVQKVAKAHGGKIRVESSPGQGASFTLILPR